MSHETETTTQEALLEAVSEQRTHTINILGAVQALKVAARCAPCGEVEMEAALELVEGSIRELLEGLEGPMLTQAAIDKQQAITEERAV